MNSYRYTSILIVLLLVLPAVLCVRAAGISDPDSLRRSIELRSGEDKINAQLDLALLINEGHKEESRELAKSALAAAQKAGKPNLIMRSYFVMGRTFLDFDDVELSQSYYDSALMVSNTLRKKSLEGEILFRKGITFQNRGEHLKALELYSKANQISLQNKNFRIAGATYSMMGTIFRLNGLYDRAIEYIIKSRLNYQKAGYNEGYGWTSYILGRIYADLKLSNKAMEYFREALQVYEKTSALDGDKTGIAICLEQLGLQYLNSGNLNKAHNYIERTLKIYSAIGSAYGISNTHSNLGKIELARGNHKKAEHYLNQALEKKIELGDRLSLPGIYEHLGQSLVQRGYTKKGISTLEQGLKLAMANQQKKVQLDICSKLAEVYIKEKDYRRANEYQKKLIELQNSMLLGAANIKMEQLQGIYEIDAKNNQIAELEKQNEINTLEIKQHRTLQTIMIIGIALALLLAFVIAWFLLRIRQKNIQLRETNAAKDRFFAIIAHDLRNPIHGLGSLAEYMSTQFNEFSEEELKELLQTLHNSSESVYTLLENLLAWAKSQVDKIEYRPEKLKLSEELERCFDGLAHSAAKKEISVCFKTSDSHFVLADRNMLQTIIRNLLSNAIKFSHRNGTVVVSTTSGKEGRIVVSIADKGIGIEKNILPKIFDLSNTYCNRGTENEESSGLGLILVNDFVEKNKGTVHIESQVGKGTTVTFSLPAVT